MTGGFCTTLSYVAFTDSESMIGDVLRIQRTPSWCQPKFIILGDGVELLRMTGWNCTTLSLSPTRTSTEFGLAGISCFPRVNQTSQWTWLLALLTRLQDVVCLLPHASQWNLPDTVEPAIEKSQKNIVLDLILHACMIQERVIQPIRLRSP